MVTITTIIPITGKILLSEIPVIPVVNIVFFSLKGNVWDIVSKALRRDRAKH